MARGSDFASAFGPGSPTYDQVYPGLLDLLRRFGDSPRVGLRFREWRYQRSIAGLPDGSGEEAFARHTYLAVLTRIMARQFLGAPTPVLNSQQLRDVLAGDFFRERGIDNFAEDDHFTWPTSPDLAQQALDVLSPLSQAALDYRAQNPGPEEFSELYRDLAGPQIPGGASTGAVQTTPQSEVDSEQSVYHAQCGSGEGLYRTVSTIAGGMLERGLDEFDTLLLVLDRVAATDMDPLAVSLARVDFLFALGGMVTGPHPPVVLPVYLSDYQSPAEQNTVSGQNPATVHTFYVGGPQLEFRLPGQVAEDIQLLEWLISRLPNYLNGAALRRISQGNRAATEAVLIAFHNYLLAPKLRTPVPDPLTPEAAAIMEQTAARLVGLYLEDEDLFWTFLLKNVAASRVLGRRAFDLTIAG